MLKRFITVAISVILFAILLSWYSYVPSSQREANIYYFGFFETFIFVILYAGPIYFLVGLPLSILIDNLAGRFIITSKLLRYFISLGIYSLTGIVIGAILLIIVNQNIYFPFLICCFFASNIYLHIFLLVSKITVNLQPKI